MSVVPPSQPASATDPFPGYAAPAGRYDECRAPDGSVRPVWAAFFRLLGANAPATLRTAHASCQRAIVEQDVSMNVYAGAPRTRRRGRSTPFPFSSRRRTGRS